jgi:NitT/TauT family transport system permease protein
MSAAAALATVVALWELACFYLPRLAFFLGRPTDVLRRASDLIASGELPVGFLVTLGETVSGLLIGVALALGAALCLWTVPRVGAIVEPHLRVAAALPTFALGPIIIFWCGTGFMSKFVLACLPAFTTALAHAHDGIVQGDPNLMRLLRVFGARRLQVVRRLAAPAALFAVLSGFRLTAGVALLGAFMGEFISSTAGLGHMIVVAEGLYDVPTMWVGVAGIVAIVLLLQGAGAAVERHLVRWRSVVSDAGAAGY